jgi:PleD family two-component response regulator
MKVLIAEDDPGSRLLLAAAVERLGHACVAAEDGHAAAELFAEQHPEVVIKDLSMPGLDGSGLVRRIRSEPDAPYAYVLVVTAQADEVRARAATIRRGDTLYRYGGEEFLVLLPEQTLEGARLAAERLRAAVEALGLPHPAGGTVTASIGVAGLGSATCSPDELFELADRALYRAKEGGRNRVEVQAAGGARAPRGDLAG